MGTVYVRGVPAEHQRWIEQQAARRDQSAAAFVRSLIKTAYDLRARADPAKFADIPQIIDRKPVTSDDA